MTRVKKGLPLYRNYHCLPLLVKNNNDYFTLEYKRQKTKKKIQKRIGEMLKRRVAEG